VNDSKSSDVDHFYCQMSFRLSVVDGKKRLPRQWESLHYPGGQVNDPGEAFAETRDLVHFHLD
jgi:hypothetical protein